MILLVAIIAAIALTLRRRKDTARRTPSRARCGRDAADRVRLVSMPSEKERMTLAALATSWCSAAILFAISVVGIFLNRRT